MTPEYLLWSLGKRFSRLKHIKIFKEVQKPNKKTVSMNTTINLPDYIFRVSFFHSFCCWTFANCMNREGLTFSMFFFLELNIREQKKYEKRMQTSVDNTVNDLLWNQVWKYSKCLKHCFSFLSKIVFYSWRHKSLTFCIFLPKQILKT